MSVLTLSIPEEFSDSRLDVVLNRFVEAIPSRSFASRLIDAGLVTLNGKTPKASARVGAGDILCVDVSFLEARTQAPQAERIPLEIIFEDEDLLVINKQAGLVVHPGAGVSSGTLVNAVLGHCGMTLPSLGEPARAGIVHRLDRDTSGVMVVAKSQRALTGLSAQFAAHTQERQYYALVYGTPEPAAGTVETWHGRDPRNRLKYAVVAEGTGKKAKLDFRVAKVFCGSLVSQVVCNLHTGRTHQIRVQLTHLGHPLLGDALYGQMPQAFRQQRELCARLQKSLTRQMLHAHVLGFVHPGTAEAMRFVCEPPEDFKSNLLIINEFTTALSP